MPKYRTITGPYADKLFSGVGVRHFELRYRDTLIIECDPLASDERLQQVGEFANPLTDSESLQHYKVSIAIEPLKAQLSQYVTDQTAILDAQLAASTITQQEYDDAIALLNEQYSYEGITTAYVPWFISYDDCLTWLPLRSKTIEQMGQVRITIELVTLGVEFS